jgi:hypothetical protein
VKSLSLVFLVLGISVPCFAGHAEGNGGDAYALEFVAIARQVQHFFASRPTGSLPAIDATAFENAIDTTTVTSVDDVLYLVAGGKWAEKTQ